METDVGWKVSLLENMKLTQLPVSIWKDQSMRKANA